MNLFSFLSLKREETLAYSSSKAAVISLTKVQGKAYPENAKTINIHAQAVMRTKLLETVPEKQIKYFSKKISMKRCGNFE